MLPLRRLDCYRLDSLRLILKISLLRMEKSHQKYHYLSLNIVKVEFLQTTNDLFDDTASDVTAETRISQFTACTNPTFDRVHRQWK